MPPRPSSDIFSAAETCTKRRPWNPDEDEQLRHLVEVHGVKNWALIATQLNMRNGKQCRERWRNHLRPELNKGDWDMHDESAEPVRRLFPMQGRPPGHWERYRPHGLRVRPAIPNPQLGYM